MSNVEPEEGFHPEDYGLNPAQTTISNAELRKLRKELEKAKARADEAEKKAAQTDRQLLFTAAGVKVDDPAAKYFVAGYDGDMTPEAIRAAAIEARVIVANQNDPALVAGHEAALAAAAGAAPPGAGPDLEAKLAELAKKQFAASDDLGREQNIRDILDLARQSGGMRVT